MYSLIIQNRGVLYRESRTVGITFRASSTAETRNCSLLTGKLCVTLCVRVTLRHSISIGSALVLMCTWRLLQRDDNELCVPRHTLHVESDAKDNRLCSKRQPVAKHKHTGRAVAKGR